MARLACLKTWSFLAAALAGALGLASCGGGGGGGGGDTIAPTDVAGLTASAASSSRIDLAWSASSDDVGVAGYKVLRSAAGGPFALQQTATGTSASDTGVSPETAYCYRIVAVDAAGNESTPCAPACATTPPTLAFAGFDFALSSGTFWEYRWDFYENTWAQGSSPSTTTDAGRFWVVLGAPTTIQGTTAYAVQVLGHGKSGSKAFSPRWGWLALANDQLLGSTDGQALVPIFDAKLGKWPGGGFFTSLPGSTLSVAKNGTISQYNTHVSGPAIVTGRSASQSQCQYFPGVGNICGDSSYDYTENEYFRAGIGPVGYFYSNSYSDCGGGFCSGGTWRHDVGLTASSLTGQVSPLITESEPDDGPASAMPITAATPVVGSVAQSTLANSGNTVITVTVTDDGGATGTVSPTVEDWYSFTLAATTTVTISLSFEGSPTADLDLFLTSATGSRLYGYSIHDNPARHDQNERITTSLGAGSYRIGVDGYLTPAGPVTYTLQLED